MITNNQSSIAKLYREDFVLWVDETVKQLQDRDIVNLDWEHLTEEIEALGNEQRRKVSSYLKQILIHLLLYRYWVSEKERCSRSWEKEIESFRDNLEDLLESKTLYNHFSQEIERIYPKALSRVIQKTGLDRGIFPTNCPFTPAEILDFGFLPD
ncbi:DUF29 domain-containing protein [Gloeocapsa sp. PCC 73106]|uniref:DUF29 domain-containing protein n=1 Tax=Gloeocapsa sp. PCC 73106 TaxID=102232 RepID=UPI0002ACF09F|nr:DUF29 domain-containing protein [Gloeocapsa sp. PCC 73106]ELR98768.1 protein of unknown function DUF29 [Gloeocapsa sp. PCC 73106]